MVIFPAIDIKNGQCVRLQKGDFSTTHTVASSAVNTAEWFAERGANWVHMVDLDGALDGVGANLETIKKVAKNVQIKVQLGGGLRDMLSLDRAFDTGISRAVIGSAAVGDHDFLAEALQKYGDRIAVGVDALNGEVRVSGWTQGSGLDCFSFASKIASLGVKYIIFTDISRDGMLSGPPVDALKRLVKSVDCEIIASGGVGCNADIDKIKATGAYGAIIGKAIYSNNINLELAVKQCKI